ncbi:ABC transporter permease [Amycolatopsis anabasis]|uniref:ABC transporter permease n=1 Tax=Amycolatopsis anabasis TaxID=1840409 RepID=UPI00131DBB2E|nr:ABC transporter permease [Amycolatopsis anabasis]
MTTTLDRPRTTHHAPSESPHPLLGTWQMTRLALRRDRIILPIWVLLIGLIPSAGANAYEELYKTPAERASLTAGAGANPSLSLLYGPPFDLSTAGGWTTWRYGTLIPLFLALACVFTVTRHTRQEEDTGRQELLSSTVLGRYAPLTAAVLVSGAASLVTGLLITAGMAGAKLPASGALAFGLGTALVGWVFTGVAAIAAQLAEYSRTANGIATAVLGVTFLFRAVGDSAKDIDWLSWLSPIGWGTQVRPFAQERWWVLLLLLAAAVVLGGIGYALLPRRDIGMGLYPARPGPAAAAETLRSPFALAWRLHRGALIGWGIGFALMGAMLGSLVAGIGDVVGDSEQTRQMLERMGGASGIEDAFLAAMTGMVGAVATMYAVQATLRMRSEEVALRVEPLLATRVGRLRWAGSHLVFALLGTAVLMAVAGLAMGLLHGLRISDVSGQVPAVLGASLAQLPAAWVVVAASVLLFAFLPKFATAAWAVAAFFVLLKVFGPVAQVSQAVLNISPFTHIPQLPSAEFTATPLLWLTGIAIVALAAGLARFRQRDIG